MRDDFAANVATDARPVVNDDWSTETLRQRRTNEAWKDVGRETGRPAND
jgi:hypothetical protein